MTKGFFSPFCSILSGRNCGVPRTQSCTAMQLQLYLQYITLLYNAEKNLCLNLPKQHFVLLCSVRNTLCMLNLQYIALYNSRKKPSTFYPQHESFYCKGQWSFFLFILTVTFCHGLQVSIWICICISFDGVVITAQCTATFSDLLCSPEFRYY